MDLKNHYFWAWFLENHLQIRNLRTLSPQQQKEITYWLDWHLHFYCPGIDCLLVFPEREHTDAEMIITANGDESHYSAVEALVAEAPELEGWMFTAFIRSSADINAIAKGLDKPYIMHDIVLKASELEFAYLGQEAGKMNLMVYLKNYHVRLNTENLLQLVYIMLQDVLGEKYFHQNINFIQIGQKTITATDMIELYELEAYIDKINQANLRRE